MAPRTTRALVAHEPTNGQLNWNLEDINLRELQPTELLVRIVAAGVCHTDIVFGMWPPDQIPYPKVLGHEGSGIVLEAGSDVRSASTGDAVLLSFQSCNACKSCRTSHPSFCDAFGALNYGGDGSSYTTAENKELRGAFFGQSSFSQLAIVKESSVVNVSGSVRDEEELKLFAPMGCGFQTGMGTVDNVADAGVDDVVVVLGLGGVGLLSIVAAKLRGCKAIIGIDRLSERLELAKELGATGVINTLSKDVDISDKLTELAGEGASVTIDTTGSLDLIRQAVQWTTNRGQIILVGVPAADALLDVHLIQFMQTGKIIRGSIEGDAIPSKYIPKMINWYREGKLPIEKLIKLYPVC
ncbi:hypothetical protein ASPVEDRAFT_53610 [Aspergillus versicolor CBS 583.65]|uniref:Enoyl reductase (ER) domain-containing protein n=1 Tax=Aspergillus versicolor CBS 583.65 TaxID=1036611 RepID=A0A1L9PNS7_ASPVE|nr:uncharacterized protein ASPVEDRAFT_53610 [Aspergillus versicolor CBS 583.65]OJJ03065.1 hypothetical protein ASPVEDRAFT_53610 [Aspergillus versicolor CBS 583.65]